MNRWPAGYQRGEEHREMPRRHRQDPPCISPAFMNLFANVWGEESTCWVSWQDWVSCCLFAYRLPWVGGVHHRENWSPGSVVPRLGREPRLGALNQVLTLGRGKPGEARSSCPGQRQERWVGPRRAQGAGGRLVRALPGPPSLSCSTLGPAPSISMPWDFSALLPDFPHCFWKDRGIFKKAVNAFAWLQGCFQT